MGYLIEIGGNGSGVDIIPTVSTEFADRVNGEVSINMDRLLESGFDGLLSVKNGELLNCDYTLASGMETCVQVRMRHKWQDVDITSNVPIYKYSYAGYMKSLWLLLIDKLNGK